MVAETVPVLMAYTGVPCGAAMSSPECGRFFLSVDDAATAKSSSYPPFDRLKERTIP